ncbi:MAG: hypothetical protein H7Z10_00075 [Gemmatimonadaceae bacterium]|nr:hypothetical protein [Acetobacteraceae bacterium]
MIEIQHLEPHDPLPEGLPPRVVVLQRFDEDDPRRVVTEITLTGPPGRHEAARPSGADGTPMPLSDAIEAARKVAETEGLDRVYVLDRTAGRLEHDVIDHRGDHSFSDIALSDTNLDDGERGSDLRDRKP